MRKPPATMTKERRNRFRRTGMPFLLLAAFNDFLPAGFQGR